MKPLTDNKSASEKAPTNADAEAQAKFAATLDKDFASVVVSGGGPTVDDQAGEYGQTRQRPDFVRADDAGWDAPTQVG